MERPEKTSPAPTEMAAFDGSGGSRDVEMRSSGSRMSSCSISLKALPVMFSMAYPRSVYAGFEYAALSPGSHENLNLSDSRLSKSSVSPLVQWATY